MENEPQVILSMLEDLETRLENIFIPFIQEDSAYFNQPRMAAIKVIGSISAESTSLVENISNKAEYYEVIMLHQYLQGVARCCYCLTYLLDPKSEKMWYESTQAFSKAEKLAELLEDRSMKDKINDKKAKLYPKIAAEWSTQDHSLDRLSMAINAWQWIVDYYGVDTPQGIEAAKSLNNAQVYCEKWREKLAKNSASESSNSESSLSNTKQSFLLFQYRYIFLGIGMVMLIAGQWLIAIPLLCAFLWLYFNPPEKDNNN